MSFVYFYKTSDGVRHEAEIDAPNRDAAFAALRKQGIRPIKVLAKDGSRANGETKVVGKRLVFAALAVGLAVGAVAAFFGTRRTVPFYRADGTVAQGRGENVAVPMARRQIFGDPKRVGELVSGGARFLFANPAELYLAGYAIPGRAVAAAPGAPSPAPADFTAALESPIYTFPGEMSECVQLKGIVAGLKEELRMFLASGGTLAEYRVRLDARQSTEAKIRSDAEHDVAAAVAKVEGDSADAIRPAYAVWTATNERLSALGIDLLTMPDCFLPFLGELNGK